MARSGIPNGSRRSYPVLGGRLHFVKFETHKINECLDFINSKQLHRGGIVMIGTTPLIDLLVIFVGYVYSFANIVVDFSLPGIDSHSSPPGSPSLSNENTTIKVFHVYVFSS